MTDPKTRKLPGYFYECLEHLKEGNYGPMRAYSKTLTRTIIRILDAAKPGNRQWVERMVDYYRFVQGHCELNLQDSHNHKVEDKQNGKQAKNNN